MTPKARRQAYVLGALVALLAVVLYIQLRPTASPSGSTSQTATATAPSNQVAGGPDSNIPVTDVKLEALNRDEAAPGGSQRNPFRFQQKAPPPAPRVEAPPPPVFTPPPVTGPPPPPPIPLRYVGYLGAAAQPTAILADARGTPFYGKEGDIIEGRYRVLRVATDSVDVAYADGRGRQTLRLTSQ